ncbi:MAG: DUF523 domain-containing protein [Actinomycetota bacterium]
MASREIEPIVSASLPKADDVAKVLVSGCINGEPIRYNQTNVEVVSPIWDRWVAEGRVVHFCGELAAGMPIPRPPAEILGGDGLTVFAGGALVIEDDGSDVTDLFMTGAALTVAHALKEGCVAAVLTDGSPSCGSTYIYNGGFDGGTAPGTGVVAQALIDAGIAVFPEDQLEQADAFLRRAS